MLEIPHNEKTHAVMAFGLWFAVSLSALWLVAEKGFTVPYADEWTLIPVATGNAPVTFQWLWAPHNEHRIVVPKLIYLAVGHLSGFNFQAATYFNVFALSFASLVLMTSAAKLRGHPRAVDAIIPIALLHWGQFVNLGLGFQLCFVTSSSLVCLILATVATCGPRLTVRRASIVAVLLTTLALCGSNGIACVPAILVWIGFAAFAEKTPTKRAVLVGLGMIPALTVLLCIMGLPTSTDGPLELWPVTRTSLQFLTGALGPVNQELWPLSVVVIGLPIAAAFGQLVRRARQGEERLRAVGFASIVASICSLSIAIGYGRFEHGPEAGFMTRYTTLAAPLICCLSLQAACYGVSWRPKWILINAKPARLQVGLLLVFCALWAIHAKKGIRYANSLNERTQGLISDARRGFPDDVLARRYNHQLQIGDVALFTQLLSQLREKSLGPFRGISATARFISVSSTGATNASAALGAVSLADRIIVTQRVKIESKGRLFRVDVGVPHQGLTEKLSWSLFRRDAFPSAPPVTSGTISSQTKGHRDFKSLAISNIPVESGEELIVVLQAVGDGSAKLPLFDVSLEEHSAEIRVSQMKPQPQIGCLQVFSFVYTAKSRIASRILATPK